MRSGQTHYLSTCPCSDCRSEREILSYPHPSKKISKSVKASWDDAEQREKKMAVLTSDQFRQKISKISKEVHSRPEVKKLKSRSYIERYGQEQAEVEKSKRRGKKWKHTEETKALMSKLAKERNPEQQEKQSMGFMKYINELKTIGMSEEQRKKLVEAHTGKKHPEEVKAKMRKSQQLRRQRELMVSSIDLVNLEQQLERYQVNL